MKFVDFHDSHNSHGIPMGISWNSRIPTRARLWNYTEIPKSIDFLIFMKIFWNPWFPSRISIVFHRSLRNFVKALESTISLRIIKDSHRNPMGFSWKIHYLPKDFQRCSRISRGLHGNFPRGQTVNSEAGNEYKTYCFVPVVGDGLEPVIKCRVLWAARKEWGWYKTKWNL